MELWSSFLLARWGRHNISGGVGGGRGGGAAAAAYIVDLQEIG